MPSPFPGMDPYLEGDLWPGFHHELAVQAKQLLLPLLTPRYYPFTERYFLMDDDVDLTIGEERVMPDVGIAEKGGGGRLRSPEREMAAPLVLEVPMPMPVAHYRVVIRTMPARKLVAAIEFLSPTNKRGQGREQYLRKRNRLLVRPVNLIEIDLLHQGRRVPVKGKHPAGAYFVYVSRAQERPKIKVWPRRLEQPLPVIPLPLKGTDVVDFDVQQAMTNVYNLGGYDTIIDYSQPPTTPLSAQERAWMAKLLQSGRGGRGDRMKR
jgi:hypothetical protein